MKTKFLILTLSLSAFVARAEECVVIRAAFDVGSASTKLKVAEVDVCRQRILRIIHEEERRVDYAQSLADSALNQKFSRETQLEGARALGDLQKIAAAHGATEFAGVATAAFRTARNGSQQSEQMATESGVVIRTISQTEEGQIAFYGAMAVSDINQEKIAVWDIGGKSMQLTQYTADKKFMIYEGQLGSVVLKLKIIDEIQDGDTRTTMTPNPIAPDDFLRSVELVQKYAREVSPEVRLELTNKEILGVGGVITKSLRNLIGKDEMSQKDILDAYTNLAAQAKTDGKELDDAFVRLKTGSKYPDTDISNLALVLGYMRALGIDKIKSVNVNLADGILINPNYYETRP